MDTTGLYSTVTVSEIDLGSRKQICHKIIGKRTTFMQTCPMSCLHAILDMIHFDFTSLVDEIMQIA